jgi:hypothetical protein
MEKVLLYNFYVSDCVIDNKNYIIHKECLKNYINVFDKIIFYITIDDITNSQLINESIDLISEICNGKEYEINVRKNNLLCESYTFKTELIDNRHKYKDSLVFIAHTKNVSRLNKDLYINYEKSKYGVAYTTESLLKWTIGLYFYSLNFIKEMEQRLFGIFYKQELFYGPFLMYINDRNFNNLDVNISNFIYPGCFYWINMAKFNNIIDSGKIKLLNVSDRYYFEYLPSFICDRKEIGDGLTSHNDVAITDEYKLYHDDYETWNRLFELLGDSEEFWKFYNNIINKVNN